MKNISCARRLLTAIAIVVTLGGISFAPAVADAAHCPQWCCGNC